MANISRTADPIFNFFFLKCAEFNLESRTLGQIFDISLNFSEKLEKLIFRPGNHEIGNTAKFWRGGKKPMPHSVSAIQIIWKQLVWFQHKKKINFVGQCYISETKSILPHINLDDESGIWKCETRKKNKFRRCTDPHYKLNFIVLLQISLIYRM